MTNLFDLSGKVVVITGSTRGIGRAIAEACAQAGAKIVISSRRQQHCEKVAAELQATGAHAVAIACHIGNKDDLPKLVAAAKDQLGPIDCLVCNACVSPHFGSLAEATDQSLAHAIDSNVVGALRLCNLVFPDMAQRGGGSAIFVSSTRGFLGSPVLGVQDIFKAAQMQLARDLAVEWGPRNVRVNCIAPGLVRTEFARRRWEDPEERMRVERLTPLGRIGNPDDVAGAAVFLASSAAKWITGQTIVVDGGALIAGR